MSEEFICQEKEYLKKIQIVYMESKCLFINAEEMLSQMGFFVAPIVEHRDALDHIMRYFAIKEKHNLTEKAIKELDKALGHEIRAYFDIADFTCITIRQEINTALSKVSSRKIKKTWKDYVEVRDRVVHISEEIAEIRMKRNGSLSDIEKYKVVLEEMFNIYKLFITKIEPQLKRGFRKR